MPLVFGPWSATPTYWASWDIYLGAMSPEEGSGICVLPLPSPTHTLTNQLLKSRGKSRSSLTPGQEPDKSVWLGYRWPPAKADSGSKELPWAWHQVGLGPGTQHLLGSTADWRCIQSLPPVHPYWQLLLPPTESSTENECGWTAGHGYGGPEPLLPSTGQW